MPRHAALAGIVLTLAGAVPASADHIIEFYFAGTITVVEGSAPPGVRVGESVQAVYTFDSRASDAEPFPGVGIYPDAMRFTHTRVGTRPPIANLRPGPITVIDDSARGDVYRATMRTADGSTTIGIELIDAESGAVSSDALMTDIDLGLYQGKFDVAEITVDVNSPSPGAAWRVVARIDQFDGFVVFCRCDWNRSDSVDSQDFFDYMADYFAGEGDYNFDGITNTQDFFDFLNCFFSPASGCPL